MRYRLAIYRPKADVLRRLFLLEILPQHQGEHEANRQADENLS